MDQESLIHEIKVLSDSIRKKTQALKLGISERENFIESTFKPVVGSLKEISNKLHTRASSPHDGGNEISLIHDKNDEEEQAYKDSNDELSDNEVDIRGETGSRLDEEEKNVSNISALAKDITSKGLLTRKYLMKMLQSTPKSKSYHVYGARLDKNGLMIGDAPLEVDEEDNLKIKGKSYQGTQGVFELIFKSYPTVYTTRDLKIFKNILKLTNAHKKNYSTNSPVYRNSSKKYKSIIVKLFPPRSVKQTGKGLTMKRLDETNIIYYNNVNKIVERLQLVWEAKQAGHSGVNNEIVALTDELRKRGYIR